jgi:hypothetical protein
VWCGLVRLGPDRLLIHDGGRPAGAHGLLEFVCPSCDRLNLRRLERRDIQVLSGAGVMADDLPAPYELLERRSGPPISWDDLIDFHEAMSRSDPGSIDPVSDARRTPAEQERHAA